MLLLWHFISTKRQILRGDIKSENKKKIISCHIHGLILIWLFNASKSRERRGSTPRRDHKCKWIKGCMLWRIGRTWAFFWKRQYWVFFQCLKSFNFASNRLIPMVAAILIFYMQISQYLFVGILVELFSEVNKYWSERYISTNLYVKFKQKLTQILFYFHKKMY